MTGPALVISRPTLKPLTGLRFLAAIAVVLYHALNALAPHAPGPLARLVSAGYLGVSLFFVLSGFILTYTYVDPDSGALRGTARDFWWARIARVYPMYAVALVLALPIFFLYRIMLAPPAARAEATLAAGLTPLLLQAWWPRAACQWNCPGWSLSVEMFFYALLPLVSVCIARSRRNLWAIGALSWAACIAVPLLYLVLTPSSLAHPTRFDQSFWLQAAKFNPAAHLGEFLVGITTCLAFVRRVPTPRALRALRWSTLGVAMAGAVLLATRQELPYLFLHDGLLAPFWAAAIFTLAVGGGAMARILASRPLVRLGESSYALYLVHLPILGFVVLTRDLMRIRHPGSVAPVWLPVAAYLLVSIGASLLLFRRIEEPARRRIRSWAARRKARWREQAPSPLRPIVGATIE